VYVGRSVEILEKGGGFQNGPHNQGGEREKVNRGEEE